MKKYLLGVAALILALTFSAFTTKSGTKSTDPLFAWFTPAGVFTGNIETQPDEAVDTDCTGIYEVCEYGYDDEEDFIEGDPANGLAPGATPDASVKEVNP